jgi:glycosyltransferase involved in cell wall biosynthesis
LNKKLPETEDGYEYENEYSEDNKKNIKLDLPKISIVTPSFNQGRFIERTIRCILNQGYPNLEYIIIDGGSTDDTIKIIKKYEEWLTYWVSEKDDGMYNAINKGFSKSTGDIMAWSPTGDLYAPNSLHLVGEVFQKLNEVKWLSSIYKIKINEKGYETARYKINGYDRRAFMKGLNSFGMNSYARYMIQQQSTFWRRSLWEKAGAKMDDSMKGAGDFELWTRFFCYEKLYTIDEPIGIFMTHEGQESIENSNRMILEQEKAFKRIGGKHIGAVEGYIRRKILKKRPFNYLKYLYPFGFKSQIISINEDHSVIKAKKKYFI